MTPIPDETITRALSILGSADIAQDSIESRIRELVNDAMEARRLIDWIPEVFGYVLLTHLPEKVRLPTAFLPSTVDRQAEWLPLTTEPIFVSCLPLAHTMYHEQPAAFIKIASRSSMADSIIQARQSGDSLEGASVSGPAFLGIPAEVYPLPKKKKSFWKRLFS